MFLGQPKKGRHRGGPKEVYRCSFSTASGTEYDVHTRRIRVGRAAKIWGDRVNQGRAQIEAGLIARCPFEAPTEELLRRHCESARSIQLNALINEENAARGGRFIDHTVDFLAGGRKHRGGRPLSSAQPAASASSSAVVSSLSSSISSSISSSHSSSSHSSSSHSSSSLSSSLSSSVSAPRPAAKKRRRGSAAAAVGTAKKSARGRRPKEDTRSFKSSSRSSSPGTLGEVPGKGYLHVPIPYTVHATRTHILVRFPMIPTEDSAATFELASPVVAVLSGRLVSPAFTRGADPLLFSGVSPDTSCSRGETGAPLDGGARRSAERPGSPTSRALGTRAELYRKEGAVGDIVACGSEMLLRGEFEVEVDLAPFRAVRGTEELILSHGLDRTYRVRREVTGPPEIPPVHAPGQQADENDDDEWGRALGLDD